MSASSPDPLVKHRLGGWLPADRALIRTWLRRKVAAIRAIDPPRALAHQSVIDLGVFIATNPDVRILFNLMLEQVPYNQDPTGNSEIRSVDELLLVFDTLLGEGPEWLYTTQGQQGLIGFPLNAVLDWPMATAAGIGLFLRPDVNTYLRSIINEYGSFLTTPASTSVLNTDATGWFNQDALNVMVNVAAPPPQPQSLSFDQIFACDPNKPAYGYNSYDDFMTRQFVAGRRPIASPDDQNVITSACESAPLQTLQGADVQLLSQFWVKGQPYSLADILGTTIDPLPFVGGTLYQAFLSALSYHCWHAPTSGVVKKIVPIEGTYYAENYWQGFAGVPDPSAPNNSQPYICQVATRSIMLLESSNPAIGLMAIIPVGMAEVSSCEWTVNEGQTVTKGDPIGKFHFGGSTHLLLFRKGVNLTFEPYPANGENFPVCGALATVGPSS